jgi:E3 ubiquitin-protein ligase UBR1
MISTNNPVTAFHTASMFQQIDLGVILRLSFDVFQEESVGVMLGWLADMSASVIGGDENLFRRLLWTALNEKRLNRPGGQGTRLASDLLELSLNPNETKRIDWMMLLDARLWKQAKFNMRQIYANIYSLDWDVKKGLACRFAFNYVRMLEHYMFHEKDSDMNLIFCMTYMVFGNGDACAYAAEHSELLTKVIQVAQSWYTNQMVSTMQIPVPPQNIQGLRVTPESLAFKHKRGITIFSHARVLFRHKAIQRLMIDQPQYFTHAVELLNMFVGLQPQRRETGEHVEYEVEWTRPFSLLGEIAKASRELGEAFKFATPQRLLTSLADVATRIMDDIMLSSSTLDADKYQRPNTHQVRNVLAPGSDFTCIEGNMLQTKAFSFHHYLNLLYAEMFKRIKDVIPFDEEGRYDGSNLTDLVDDVILGGPGETRAEWYKLLLMEWPLQSELMDLLL